MLYIAVCKIPHMNSHDRVGVNVFLKDAIMLNCSWFVFLCHCVLAYPAMSYWLNKTGRPILFSCSWPAYQEGHMTVSLLSLIGQTNTVIWLMLFIMWYFLNNWLVICTFVYEEMIIQQTTWKVMVDGQVHLHWLNFTECSMNCLQLFYSTNLHSTWWNAASQFPIHLEASFFLFSHKKHLGKIPIRTSFVGHKTGKL